MPARMPLAPSKLPMSKDSLLPLLAQHVLAQGLGQASLRPLAKAAGTSDRMLLYHFGTKEALITELLAYLAHTYAATLDAALAGDRPTTRGQVVARILKHALHPATQPFTALWWEIVAGAARGLDGSPVFGARPRTAACAASSSALPTGPTATAGTPA